MEFRRRKPSRLQVVLIADGRIAFNYADVALRDGIVGLFSDEEVTKGNLIASIVDQGGAPDGAAGGRGGATVT